MKSTVFTILFLLLASLSFSQTTNEDVIRLNSDSSKISITNINQYPTLHERKIFDEKSSITDKSYLNKFDTNISTDQDRTNLNIQIPQYYVGPSDPFLSNSLSPFANDYKLYNSIQFSDKSSINTSSIHETYLTIGSLARVNVMYNYSFNEKITLSGGSYIAKYQFGGQIYNDAGINAAIKYKINDRISIQGFGQYSGFSRQNRLDVTDRWDMIPTTNYGGAFEYKVTDNFGVMGGVTRQLNPMTGKWKNVPFFAPVFYKNK